MPINKPTSLKVNPNPYSNRENLVGFRVPLPSLTVGGRQQSAAAGGPRCAGGRAAAGRGGRSGRPWPGAAVAAAAVQYSIQIICEEASTAPRLLSPSPCPPPPTSGSGSPSRPSRQPSSTCAPLPPHSSRRVPPPRLGWEAS